MPADYLQTFVKRYSGYWLAALVVGAVLGALVAGRLKPAYEGTVTVAFPASGDLNQAETNFYLYDNYYSLEAGNQEKANYLQWLAAPATVQAVFVDAGLHLPAGSAAELARTFTPVNTETSNSTTVSVTRATQNEALALAKALHDESTRFPTTANTVIVSDPLVLSVPAPTTLVTVASALGALVLTFVLTFLIDFFRAPAKHS